MAATWAQLVSEYRIITIAVHPARAPWEMTGPPLRISPHAGCTEEDLARLRAALAGLAK